jgi:hypothetical protein
LVILLDVSPGAIGQAGLNFDRENKSLAHAQSERKGYHTDSCPQIYDPLPWFDSGKRAQKEGIERKAIPGPRLKHGEPAVIYYVFGEFR